jgi:hypothetical protein
MMRPYAPPENEKSTSKEVLRSLGKVYEKDTKLKANDLSQKRMIFCPSGFNFNNSLKQI